MLKMVARNEEMDVDVEEEANEEVSTFDGKTVEECQKEVGNVNIDVDFFVSMLLLPYA